MRVLVLTQRLPYAPNRGDRIRAFHLLEALRRIATVDLVSLVHDADEAAHLSSMRERGIHVHAAPVGRVAAYARAAACLPTPRPLTLALLHSAHMRSILTRVAMEHPPDVVLAYCSSMARYALEPPLRSVPFVLDMVDVDSAKWAALAVNAPFPQRLIYRREAWCLRRFEQTAIREAAVTLVVNEREESSVRDLVEDARVRVVPNGVDLAAFRPPSPPSADPAVVFCGVMNYGPNIEAARRLATRIWPLVTASRPDARLLLVGAHPTPDVQKLATQPGVEVTGSVADVRPYLWRSAVAATPLVTARGIQNKVLEALAAGLPAVVSPVVSEGLPSEVLPACKVAASDHDFATAILDLLTRAPLERRALAEQARLEHLGWDDRLASLDTVIGDASRRQLPEAWKIRPASIAEGWTGR